MKIPSAGTPIGMADLLRAFLSGLKSQDSGPEMEEVLKRLTGVKYCFLVNSGTTAFYLILKALIRTQKTEHRTQKKEVILPAYTAPSLILPIKKLGLSYRLVDMSLETFNMDEEALLQSINQYTLAVLPVHLFGLPCQFERLTALRKEREFYIIEDSASSFGTKDRKGFHSGTRGDIGFFSFNRGKNLSTIAGGAIITNNDTLAVEIKKEVDAIPELNLLKRLRIYIEGVGLSLAVRPWFYTMFYPLISRFKSTDLHEDFESYQYTAFQGALGLSLFEKAETIFHGRESKGLYLYEALKGLSRIRLPSIPKDWKVVFNQFPIIVDDPLKRDELIKKIIKAGVEVTTLYDRPIHEIYNIPQPPLKIREGDPFPNATYMAKRLLLIPTHPFVTKKDLEKVIKIISEALK